MLLLIVIWFSYSTKESLFTEDVLEVGLVGCGCVVELVGDLGEQGGINLTVGLHLGLLVLTELKCNFGVL